MDWVEAVISLGVMAVFCALMTALSYWADEADSDAEEPFG